jgi:uncharacterized protein
VPIVRRLVRKGVPVSCAVTFMLASPIINPVVLLSTGIAFRKQSPWMVVGLRAGMALVVATAVGWIVWRILGERNALLESSDSGNGAAEEHAHRRGNPLVDIFAAAAEDFLQIGATLVVGAGLAALINSGFSRAAMTPLGSNPFAAVSGMCALAVLLNICSEADAFVAASFYAFPLAAKMAFLVLGPMLDLKLLAMYVTLFRPKAILTISGTTLVLVWLISVAGYVWIPWVTALVAR